MHRWEEELSKHPVNTTIALFEEQASRDVPIEDPLLVIEKNRFLKVALLVKDVIQNLDPDLVACPLESGPL
ncbi:hypothetical protein [Phyllobacterium sp. 628]|uniref:hypothetical protein n=1 Tax=Phyllobacterium sp. 628 TaxID=2718938 RepID=UPI001AEEF501|nr:hypothetical protein [Phyllobacterium sp. 628]